MIMSTNNADLKAVLVNEIGLFAYGKANWLEYSAKMDACFREYHIYSDELKKDIFLAAIGGKTLKNLKSIISPLTLQDSEVTYDFIIESLEKHFYPDPDSAFYISKFTFRRQTPNEIFFRYVRELRKLMVNCNFPRKGQHSKLRNQIINGAVEEVKSKFNPNTMSLSQVFEAGLMWDDSRAKKPPPRPRNHKARQNRIPTCFRCAQPSYRHLSDPCPFDWGICSGCSVKGHLSIACKYKNKECSICKSKGHIAKICKNAVPKEGAENQQFKL